jgi:hypothetical protein
MPKRFLGSRELRFGKQPFGNVFRLVESTYDAPGFVLERRVVDFPARRPEL